MDRMVIMRYSSGVMARMYLVNENVPRRLVQRDPYLSTEISQTVHTRKMWKT